MNYYLMALQKYAQFTGRATRSEYWFFVLFHIIAILILMVIDGAIGSEMAILTSIYYLATLIPSLALCIRRLHDIGKSGWWILISFVPFIGSIWLLVLTVTPSQATQNQYGPVPVAPVK